MLGVVRFAAAGALWLAVDRRDRDVAFVFLRPLGADFSVAFAVGFAASWRFAAAWCLAASCRGSLVTDGNGGGLRDLGAA